MYWRVKKSETTAALGNHPTRNINKRRWGGSGRITTSLSNTCAQPSEKALMNWCSSRIIPPWVKPSLRSFNLPVMGDSNRPLVAKRLDIHPGVFFFVIGKKIVQLSRPYTD